jgi:hypothetical protein
LKVVDVMSRGKRILRKLCGMVLIAATVGCGGADLNFPPISIEAAKLIKSGTPLAEIEATLGPSHPATAVQEQHLEGVLSKMPPEIRANAERDRSLAWGDNTEFLVVKVNDVGIAWVTAWRSR